MAQTIRTPAGAAPVIPLAILGIGLYLTWFGVHYWRSDQKYPTSPLKDVLQGKPLPAASPPASYSSRIAADVSALQPDSGPGSGTSTTSAVSSATGSAISDDALKYVGQGYVWGGPSQPGRWDCSSFANYVVGHDEGLPIPGGSWAAVTANGTQHGPATPSWMLFGTPVNYGREQPGDIVVSAEHMGIVIGGGKMVSAQDEQLGVGIAGYQSGFPGGTPFVRRVSGASPATGALA